MGWWEGQRLLRSGCPPPGPGGIEVDADAIGEPKEHPDAADKTVMSIGQANDRAGGGDPSTSTSGVGDDQGRQRDEAYVALLRSGDDGAFGLLFDAWADPVFDRISNRGFATSEATRVESDTFSTVHRRMAQQTAQQPGSDSFRVMTMRAARQEVAASSSSRVDTSLPVGPYAEDRLTRGTEAGSLAADPAVAALLWQAAELLGEQVREVLDLTHRHHLTPAEVAAVLQEPPGAIEEILRKVAAGYGAVVRARIVWRQGAPIHDALREQVAGEPRFDASMVRRVAEHLRECEECRSASQVPVPPIEVFAAIPIAVAPPGFKEEVVQTLESHGVPMLGSTAARRTDDDFPDFGEDDDFPDFDEDDDARVDRAAIAAALAETGIDEGHSLLAPPPRPDDATTVVPPLSEDDDLAGSPAEAEDDDHPSHAGVVAGAAAGAAAVGLAAGLGELPADAAMAGSGAAAPAGPMLPGGLGPMPPAPDFGPDVEPAPKAPVPSTLMAASVRKGGGGPPTPKDGSSSRNRWILVAVATVAVVALLGYILSQTGSKKQADNLNTGDQTTTSQVSSTTAVTPTSGLTGTTLVNRRRVVVRRRAGATTTTQTTVKGQVTTTTQQRLSPTTTMQVTTTVTNPLFRPVWSFTIPGSPIKQHKGIPPYWDITQGGAPNLFWAVSNNGPVSVRVSGPGFSPGSTALSGSSAGLCPADLVGNRCEASPGTYFYTLVMSNPQGDKLTETIALTVTPPTGA
jgi:hypothetical protein